ncbi:FeS assembly ATPase SufC [Aciduliprofundum boonei T469]|uniref:FeS assembly ATPase SufC n=2 Tax=Candidatus Aciduliprofundum boonei TaxID=379547 RepID=D3TC63_ACIB4|nr:FeS assembly ATPase SufC [Aciduliprofundum boonei T469]
MVIVMLQIENLEVEVENKKIINSLNLSVGGGEFHVIMGPNGSGKSTLALTLMGHPNYKITNGKIEFDGKVINDIPVDERARMGIFLTFQHPEDIDGVKIIDYLRLLLEKVKGIEPAKALQIIPKKAKEVWFSADMLSRYINVGFSGGERKRFEILQALLIKPKLLILDEPDSGVDIDSLSLISHKIRELYEQGTSILLITHYGRILEHIDPKIVRVHIMKDGHIVMSGKEELVEKIEKEGFKKVFEECGCNE